MRNLLSVLTAGTHFAQLALAELRPLLSLVEAARAGTLPPEALARGLASLGEVLESGGELSEALDEVHAASGRMKALQGALETTLQVYPLPLAAPDVESAVRAGSAAAEHLTRGVGGVQWAPFGEAQPLPAWAGQLPAVLAAALRGLVERLGHTGQPRLQGRVDSLPRSLTLVLEVDDGPLEVLEGLAAELGYLGDAVPELRVHAAEGRLSLRFLAPGGRA